MFSSRTSGVNVNPIAIGGASGIFAPKKDAGHGKFTVKVVLPRSLGSTTIVLKATPSTSIRDLKERVLAHVDKNRNGNNEADRDMKPGGARPGLARGYSMSVLVTQFAAIKGDDYYLGKPPKESNPMETVHPLPEESPLNIHIPSAELAKLTASNAAVTLAAKDPANDGKKKDKGEFYKLVLIDKNAQTIYVRVKMPNDLGGGAITIKSDREATAREVKAHAIDKLLTSKRLPLYNGWLPHLDPTHFGLVLHTDLSSHDVLAPTGAKKAPSTPVKTPTSPTPGSSSGSSFAPKEYHRLLLEDQWVFKSEAEVFGVIGNPREEGKGGHATTDRPKPKLHQVVDIEMVRRNVDEGDEETFDRYTRKVAGIRTAHGRFLVWGLTTGVYSGPMEFTPPPPPDKTGPASGVVNAAKGALPIPNAAIPASTGGQLPASVAAAAQKVQNTGCDWVFCEAKEGGKQGLTGLDALRFAASKRDDGNQAKKVYIRAGSKGGLFLAADADGRVGLSLFGEESPRAMWRVERCNESTWGWSMYITNCGAPGLFLTAGSNGYVYLDNKQPWSVFHCSPPIHHGYLNKKSGRGVVPKTTVKRWQQRFFVLLPSLNSFTFPFLPPNTNPLSSASASFGRLFYFKTHQDAQRAFNLPEHSADSFSAKVFSMANLMFMFDVNVLEKHARESINCADVWCVAHGKEGTSSSEKFRLRIDFQQHWDARIGLAGEKLAAKELEAKEGKKKKASSSDGASDEGERQAMELSAASDKDRDHWIRALRREVQPPPPPATTDTKVKRQRDRIHTHETVKYFKRQAELEAKKKEATTVKLYTGGKKLDRNVARVGGHDVSMHYGGRSGEPLPKAPERKEKPVSVDVGIMIAGGNFSKLSIGLEAEMDGTSNAQPSRVYLFLSPDAQQETKTKIGMVPSNDGSQGALYWCKAGTGKRTESFARRMLVSRIRTVIGGTAVANNARLIAAGVDPQRYLCITSGTRTLHLQADSQPVRDAFLRGLQLLHALAPPSTDDDDEGNESKAAPSTATSRPPPVVAGSVPVKSAATGAATPAAATPATVAAPSTATPAKPGVAGALWYDTEDVELEKELSQQPAELEAILGPAQTPNSIDVMLSQLQPLLTAEQIRDAIYAAVVTDPTDVAQPLSDHNLRMLLLCSPRPADLRAAKELLLSDATEPSLLIPLRVLATIPRMYLRVKALLFRLRVTTLVTHFNASIDNYVAALTSLIHATRLHTIINGARQLLGQSVDGGADNLKIMPLLPSLGEVKTGETSLLEFIATQMNIEKQTRLAAGTPVEDDLKPSIADECKAVLAVAPENFMTLVAHVGEMESLLIQVDREIKRNTSPAAANDAWVTMMTDFVTQAAPVVMEMKGKLEQMPLGKQHVLGIVGETDPAFDMNVMFTSFATFLIHYAAAEAKITAAAGGDAAAAPKA